MLKSVCARPTVTVVLPSPAAVGEMAVTRTSLPSGLSALSRSKYLGAYLPHERAIAAEFIGFKVETARDVGDW